MYPLSCKADWVGPNLTATIRRTTVKDLELLHKIEIECFTLDAFTVKQIASLLEDPYTVSLAACENEEVLGFIIGMIHDSGETRIGHIYTLDVVPKHRRKGIGLQLLTELERIFVENSVEDCYLEVRASNLGALQLYRKHGYRKVELLKNYYSEGTHGIRFRKKLST